MLKRMFKPAPLTKPPPEPTLKVDEDKAASDYEKAKRLVEEENKSTIAAQKTAAQILVEWIQWIFLLPMTVPMYCVSKSISLLWSAFCVFTLVMAAITVYLPIVGDKLS